MQKRCMSTTGCRGPARTGVSPKVAISLGWHPLVSGDSQTVIDAGISVYGNVIPESAVHPEEPVDEYVVRWVHEP